MEKDVKIMSELAEAREKVYRFLASIYLEAPSESLIKSLKNGSFMEAVSNIPGASKEGFTQTASYSIEDLKQEYIDLFMVPTSKYVAPYEAVYCDECIVGGRESKGLLYGQSTVAVENFYKMAGAELGDQIKDLPDHMGLELAFMAFMCGRERQAWEAEDETLAKALITWEKEFLASHPARWCEELFSALQKKAHGEFYCWAARFTSDFISADLRTLEALK